MFNIYLLILPYLGCASLCELSSTVLYSTTICGVNGFLWGRPFFSLISIFLVRLYMGTLLIHYIVSHLKILSIEMHTQSQEVQYSHCPHEQSSHLFLRFSSSTLPAQLDPLL